METVAYSRIPWLQKVIERIIPSYQAELERAVGDKCKTLLDVGCGYDSPIQHFSRRIHSTGVDAYLPSIRKSQARKIHNDYYVMDFSEIPTRFKAIRFDCIIALDVLEHLMKEDGEKLLKFIENNARGKVIVFTPNGYLPQVALDNNPWQIHRSGWTAKEMSQKGYRVIGINGLKSLRGIEAKIKFKPLALWNLISTLTQFFVRNHPDFAFQILCVKEKEIKKTTNLSEIVKLG